MKSITTTLSRKSALSARVCWPLLLGASTLVFAGTALAQSDTSSSDTMKANPTFADMFMNQVVKGTEVHGRVGIYDFRRWHDTNQPYPGQPATKDDYNVQGTNYGAQIQLQTGRIYGFSAGGAFVYESSFYGNNAAGTKLNCNLACNGAVQNITQGFLQYNLYGLQVRAGRQLLNTPLAGADQFTFLPRSFNGVSAVLRPLEIMQDMGGGSSSGALATTSGQTTKPPLNDATGPAQNEQLETNQYMPMSVSDSMSTQPDWQIFAAKVSRYEGRGNADRFVKNNRYFRDVAGFWSVGTSFMDKTQSGTYMAQYYHYTFQQTENAEYAEIGYMTPVFGASGDSSGFAPYFRAQYLKGYNADKSRIPQGINADIYGLKLGIDAGEVGFAIFGNYSPKHNGSFNNGQYLHPYTDLSGVLYTDTMNDGIQEIGPGYSYGARFDFTPSDNLSMYARYVEYLARTGHYHDFYFAGDANNQITDASFTGKAIKNQTSHAIGIGATYDLGGLWDQLAGLKINDNLGITVFDGAPNAPNFYDNRIRFYYSF